MFQLLDNTCGTCAHNTGSKRGPEDQCRKYHSLETLKKQLKEDVDFGVVNECPAWKLYIRSS